MNWYKDLLNDYTNLPNIVSVSVNSGVLVDDFPFPVFARYVRRGVTYRRLSKQERATFVSLAAQDTSLLEPYLNSLGVGKFAVEVLERAPGYFNIARKLVV